MRKFFSLIAAVLFAGSMIAAEAPMAKASEKAYDATVNGKTAIKVGTGSVDGAMTITVAPGATKLNFYVAAWNGAAGNIKIEVPGADAQTMDITADEGISGSATDYTLTGEEATFAKELPLSNIAEETVITLSSGTARRFVVWGAEDDTEETVEDTWAKILFTEAVAAADLAADAEFVLLGSDFKVAITDTDNKMSIDANVARFGTAAGYDKYDFRLKSGGKSSSKNSITATIPADGELRIAVRTASSSDETRTLVLVQEGDTIYNQIVKDDDAIEVAIDDSTKVKVFPYVTVPVKAGEIAVGYPVGAINFYAFGFNGTVAPVPEPDTIPTVAPAAPKQAEKDVMAIYCDYYKENNANFAISGWAGGYQTLDLEGTKVAYWNKMTWECIIDPVKTDTAHDFSAYEYVHFDMWAPAPAKIKFTAEAVAGGNYKDGMVAELKQGWNCIDLAIAEWPSQYDFKNVKCFVLEQYQTPAGESFEQNPFAIANIYFWKTPELIDPTNCAEAAEAALSVSKNNELYKDSAVYTIPGYVTEIAYAYDSTKNNMSFWMADEKNGGKVLEAYKCVIMKADDAVRVGDLVKVTGCLTKYNKTPEFAAGCTVEIVERDTTPAVEPKNLGEKTIAEFLELKNKIDTCILTGIIDSVVNTQYGNFNIVDATGKVYVYGLLNAAGETKKCYEEENLAEGDTLTIKAIYAEYNNNPQVKNAIFVAVKHQSVTPIVPLTIPETAPAAPTADVNDVLAIYCNYYKENNLNFGISGWAGGYQTLSIDSTNIGYWTKMTWECIIDPLATDSAHNLSGYKKLHVDLWAPLPAKIKFTVEAVAGGNYKDGVVANLEQGWNSCDFVVAEWPGEYDFTNVKCFVFEQYQTPKGESFEQNPFAFANIYFYDRESQGIDNTADGVKAQKFIQNGMLLIEKNGRVYTITGQAVR